MSNSQNSKPATQADIDAVMAHLVFMGSQTVAIVQLLRDLARDRPDILKKLDDFSGLAAKQHEKYLLSIGDKYPDGAEILDPSGVLKRKQSDA